MANKFEITISAVDRATAVVRNVNRALAQVTAPITRLKSSLRSLSAELGLDKIGKGLQGVGRATMDVTQRLNGMLTPLTALLGFSTLAGILEQGHAWAMVAWNITMAAQATNVAIPRLQQLDGVGKLLGVDVQTTNSSLMQFGSTLEDALYGRNQTALAMLRQLGVGFHRTKEGAIDVAASFNDMARAISNPKIAANAPVQNLIARTFGLEAMLPVLRQGPDAIKRLTDAVQASGYVMDEAAVKQGAHFQMSLQLLNITAQGLRNTIGNALIPIMGPMVERMTAWIAANRQLIASKIAEAVDSIAKAIDRVNWSGIVGGTESFVKSIQKAVDFVGGWRNALILLIGIMNAGTILSVLNLTMAVTKLSFAIGSTAITAVGSFGAALTAGIVTPAALAVTALGSIGTAAIALLNVLAPLFMAGSLGYGIGTIISKLTEGTKVGDAIGSGVAHTLAFFGNDEAQASVDRMNGTSAPGGGGAPAAPSPYGKTTAAPTGGAKDPSSSASSGGGDATRIDLFIQGLPAGARAIVSGGDAAVNLRIGSAMPTMGTP